MKTCLKIESIPANFRERRGNKSANPGEKTVWSGDATRNKTWGYTDTSVTISVNQEEKVEKEAPKDQPIWMTQSTVDGVSEVNNVSSVLLVRPLFEPPHDKTNKMIYAPSEDRSAWASAQSDQSLRCPHEESWVLSYPFSTQQTLIRLGGYPG